MLNAEILIILLFLYAVTHSIAPGNTITVANTANKTQAITLQDLKFLSSGNKCFLPITLKDGSNNDQQIMAQIDTKNLVLPGTYLQMKVDPQQITTVDGQQVVQLTSAANLPTSISLAQPHYVQTQQQSTENIQQATIVPETRTIFAGGQNITITQVRKFDPFKYAFGTIYIFFFCLWLFFFFYCAMAHFDDGAFFIHIFFLY